MKDLAARKSRKYGEEAPYMVWENASTGFTYQVLKAWQNDPTKPYARWFLATSSPYTYGTDELGDGYVADVVNSFQTRLVQVDGREPTAEEKQWASDLLKHFAQQPGGVRIF